MISFLFALALTQTTSAPSVTTRSLLQEMTDLASIARDPEPSFKLLQASSYDRAQRDPKDPKTWFANADYGQFVRTEQRGGRTEWVIMEHQGPGAIVRFWIPLLAEKDKAVIRFYFDGADMPAIEANYQDLLRGRGLFKPPFAFIAWPEPGTDMGVAGDLYFPIPFAKSCRVTLSEVPFYYAIGYRAYAPGARVETFSLSDIQALGAHIKKTGGQLAATQTLRVETVNRTEILRPKGSLTVNLPDGPSAITGIQLKLPGSITPQALRSVVVEATFDGERTVWCPIGDFFGSGTSLQPVWDRYRRADPDGIRSCSWTMPYRRSASIRIVNLGARPFPAQLKAAVEDWKWDSRSMHFHASWRRQYPLATRPMSDWNYLEAKGKGVYVGDTLTVMSPAPAWYGEGDERVYVDGESFPSQLGTGTEDYYGFAWGMAEAYSSPWISTPMRTHKGREDWTGFTTTSRVRLLDAIPFEKSIKLDMEVWDWADTKLEYAVATFWYALPGATSNRQPAPGDAAEALPEWQFLIKGALECESLPFVSKTPGIVAEPQAAGLVEGVWSGGRQLFAQCRNVGDYVELRVPAAGGDGPRKVVLYATKSYDYGIVRFSVNGKAAKEVDLYSATPKASGAIELGTFDVRGGSFVLRSEVVGANPQSKGSKYFFGLDCVTAFKSR